jgi:hypothetical protein
MPSEYDEPAARRLQEQARRVLRHEHIENIQQASH